MQCINAYEDLTLIPKNTLTVIDSTLPDPWVAFLVSVRPNKPRMLSG